MIPEDLKKRPLGGRPSNHSILLTESEYAWAQRKLERKSQLVPKAMDSSRKLKKIIGDLNDRFSEPPVSASPTSTDVVVKLNKQELEVFSVLAENEAMALHKAVSAMEARKMQDNYRYTVGLKNLAMLDSLIEKTLRLLEGNKK